MDDNKNIGNAFKERLSDLKKSPSNKVWDDIVAELDNKKKKKRAIPFWVKLTGVAATLLLLFVVGNKIIENNSKNTPVITTIKNNSVITEEKLVVDATKKEDKTKLTNTNSEKNEIKNLKITSPITTEENELSLDTKSSNEQDNLIPNSIILKNKNSKIYTNKGQNLNTELVIIEKEHKINQKEIIKNKLEKEIITKNIKPEHLSLKNKIIKEKQTDLELDINQSNDGNAFAQTEKKKIKIEDALENIEIKEKNKKEWQIAIKGAPVLYGSLTNGSSLDANLAKNTKNNNVTLSFGVSASYPINKKMHIRTGISNVDLAYDTNQVSSITLLDSQSISFSNLDVFEITNGDNFTPQNNKLDITQKITYLEVPLELKYQLINKKIDVDLISGISTLFLNNNTILSNNTKIGSVNNLKDVSFTGNFGLGLNYNLTKKLNFNLEPSLKIQLNAYNDNTDFKPYFFGVYSGFSYKF